MPRSVTEEITQDIYSMRQKYFVIYQRKSTEKNNLFQIAEIEYK